MKFERQCTSAYDGGLYGWESTCWAPCYRSGTYSDVEYWRSDETDYTDVSVITSCATRCTENSNCSHFFTRKESHTHDMVERCSILTVSLDECEAQSYGTGQIEAGYEPIAVYARSDVATMTATTVTTVTTATTATTVTTVTTGPSWVGMTDVAGYDLVCASTTANEECTIVYCDSQQEDAVQNSALDGSPLMTDADFVKSCIANCDASAGCTDVYFLKWANKFASSSSCHNNLDAPTCTEIELTVNSGHYRRAATAPTPFPVSTVYIPAARGKRCAVPDDMQIPIGIPIGPCHLMAAAIYGEYHYNSNTGSCGFAMAPCTSLVATTDGTSYYNTSSLQHDQYTLSSYEINASDSTDGSCTHITSWSECSTALAELELSPMSLPAWTQRNTTSGTLCAVYTDMTAKSSDSSKHYGLISDSVYPRVFVCKTPDGSSTSYLPLLALLHSFRLGGE